MGCAQEGEVATRAISSTSDCRSASSACAANFACLESEGTWSCVAQGDAGEAVAGGDQNDEGDTQAETPAGDPSPPVADNGEPDPPAGPDEPPVDEFGDGDDGAACSADGDCSSGFCVLDDGSIPGGLCTGGCDDDKGCTSGATCVDLVGDGDRLCLARCDGPGECRAGWTCLDIGGPTICLPRCEYLDCGEGYYCDASSGACAVEGSSPADLPEFVTVVLEQVLIRPYIVADGTNWDGTGSASRQIIDAVTTALLGPTPFAQVTSILIDQLIANTAAPDAFGSATLYVDATPYEQNLPLRDDEYVPVFGVSWDSVPLASSADVRLRVSLTDQDLADNDQIGVASVSFDEILAALASGDIYPVQVSEQGNGQILFVTVQVIPAD